MKINWMFGTIAMLTLVGRIGLAEAPPAGDAPGTDKPGTEKHGRGKHGEEKKGERDRPRLPPEEVFKKLDTDGKGTVSLAEFKEGPAAKKNPEKAAEYFKMMDKDGSGELTLEEFKERRPPHEKGKGKGEGKGKGKGKGEGTGDDAKSPKPI